MSIVHERIRGDKRSSIPLAAKVEIMKNCSDAALILYEHYLSKTKLEGDTLSDENIAEELDWNVYKVAKNRRNLVDHGYFLQVNGKLSDKRKITVTYLDPKLIHEINALTEEKESLCT